jgi:hypothetical protein
MVFENTVGIRWIWRAGFCTTLSWHCRTDNWFAFFPPPLPPFPHACFFLFDSVVSGSIPLAAPDYVSSLSLSVSVSRLLSIFVNTTIYIYICPPFHYAVTPWILTRRRRHPTIPELSYTFLTCPCASNRL